ncbi:MAG: Glu-tRNA(Gln) amidotransferase subunit GatE [Nanoarchaeota archaeon]|nr:Glu-tRNA(Gln) amidotransferase subunit GatE [Nanoarchaeota archaeon]
MIDYKKLGFKCGLEFHQQLETHKLFCNCPSIVHDDNPSINFKRKLRAVAGETGEVDLAAAFEQNKDKVFTYESCPTSSCMVEFDEEPPHEVNSEALDIVLEVALLLNCKIVDQIHFMRKTVVDGSNVSGFQRTAMVGIDGFVETSKGKVKISSVCLEEEAAKKVEDHYRLDRLGVALVEIATDPDIKDADHAKEAASIIGMILRSTGKVKRGIGTIRQDVNVSIKGKERVEVKGFQDLRSIPVVIDNEIMRQQSLSKSVPEVRKAEPDGSTTFLRPMPGAARMYPETDIVPIEITDSKLKTIKLPELLTEKAIKLEKKFNLNADLAKELIKEDIDIESYVKQFSKIDVKLLATILTAYPKDLKSRLNLDSSKLTKEHYFEIFTLLNKGEISKEAVIELMADAASGKKIDASRFKNVSEDSLKKELEKIVAKNKGASLNALMGEAMKHFRGKADGQRIMEILKTLI